MPYSTTYNVTVGATTNVSTGSGAQFAPSAIALPGGKTAVFYIDGPSASLMAQLIDSSTGALIGSAVTVATAVSQPTDDYGNPIATSVALLDGGNMVVTWAGTDQNIHLRTLDASLGFVTGIQTANQLPASNPTFSHPDVAAIAGGGFVIAFEAAFSASDHDIRYRVYDSSSAPLSIGETSVDLSTKYDEFPSVARTAAGFAIGYDQVTFGTGISSVVIVREYLANGDPIVGFPVVDGAGQYNRYVQLAPNGDSWVAYYEDSQWSGSIADTNISVLDRATGTPSMVNPTLGTGPRVPAPVSVWHVSNTIVDTRLVEATFTLSPTDHNAVGLITSGSPPQTTEQTIQGSTAFEVAGGGAWVDASHLVEVFSTSAALGGDTNGGAVGARLVTVTRTLTGGAGDDFVNVPFDGLLTSVSGGAGNDTINASTSTTLVNGGDGNDLVFATAASGAYNGEAGSDTFGFDLSRSAAGVSINLSLLWFGGTGTFGAGTVSGFEAFTTSVGSALADTFIAGFTAPAIELYAGDGADYASGGNAVDVIDGQGGNDQIYGLGGDDLLYGGDGNDLIDGGDGNDELNGGAGVDLLYGGAGNDLFRVDNAADIVFEASGGGTDTVISSVGYYLYANIENLTLSTGDVNMFGVGNDLANTIGGNAADNLLIGGGGDDTLFGNDGNDSLFGQDGADTLNGGAGIDYLVGGIGVDHLNGGDGSDALYGEDGNDFLDGGTSFDTDILVGGAGDDFLYGISGQANPDYDLLDGGAGNDVYWVDTGDDLTFEAAGGGTDTVHADIKVPNAGVYLYANVENLVLEGTTAFGVGNELDNNLTGSNSGNWLLGGAGNDTIYGGGGNDVLFGQDGSDTFIFDSGSGADLIGDFVHGSDHIQLNHLYANFAEVQAAFHQVGSDGAIDLGGGNLIVLQGVQLSTLTASDFIFVPTSEPAVTTDKAPAVMEAPGWVDTHLWADNSDGGGLARWQESFGHGGWLL